MKIQLDSGSPCSAITLEKYRELLIKHPSSPTLNSNCIISQWCTPQALWNFTEWLIERASTSLLSGRASEVLKRIHFNEQCLLHVNLSNDQPLTCIQEYILHVLITMVFSLVLESYPLTITWTWTETLNQCEKTQQCRYGPIPVKVELKRKIDEFETIGVIAKVAKWAP